MKNIEKRQTYPVYSAFTYAEPLTIFSYWFEVGKRSFIEFVIFNSPPKVQYDIPIIQGYFEKVKSGSYS